LRSAMNVAALNCLRPGDEPIIAAYSDMLKSFARPLTAANRTVDSEYRERHGSGFRPIRDEYMTQVYNYFAAPPVLPEFCDVARTVAAEYLLEKPADLEAYAAGILPRFEQPFLRFFNAYERWRNEVSSWDAQYGAQYGHI